MQTKHYRSSTADHFFPLYPSLLQKATLLCWTIQPFAGSWSLHPALLPLWTRTLKLPHWAILSPSPFHNKERGPRRTRRERGGRTAAGRSADLGATPAKWVQLIEKSRSDHNLLDLFLHIGQAPFTLNHWSQDTFGVPSSMGAEQRVTYHSTGEEASRLYVKKTIVVGNVSK